MNPRIKLREGAPGLQERRAATIYAQFFLVRFGKVILRLEAIAMRMKILGALAVAAGVLGLTMPVSAHHGTAVFDTTRTVTMKGIVTDWDWANPHCLLEFDVKNEAGQAVHWIAETQNPAEMVSLGWGKTSFKSGDEVTVTLMPAKNGKPFGRITVVTIPNGKTFVTTKEGLTPREVSSPPDGSKTEANPK